MTILRRVFVAGSAAWLFAPLVAGAQQAWQATKAPKIGIILSNAAGQYRRVFLEGFRAHGWVDGQNITIEWREARGQPERIPALVQELVELPVDLILANSLGSVLKAVQASPTIPVVVAGVTFEQLNRAGLAKSLARPGGTVTGCQLRRTLDSSAASTCSCSRRPLQELLASRISPPLRTSRCPPAPRPRQAP